MSVLEGVDCIYNSIVTHDNWDLCTRVNLRASLQLSKANGSHRLMSTEAYNKVMCFCVRDCSLDQETYGNEQNNDLVLFQRASGRTGIFFLSFCRSQTPHSQCNCYSRSCLRRSLSEVHFFAQPSLCNYDEMDHKDNLLLQT